jgi:pilus assembly protein CpaB
MTRRIIAAVAALLLAVLGAVVLIDWVNDADARARADEELVDVLVVESPVAAGTSADELGASVSVEQVPDRLKVDGVVADLSELAGQVATASLMPGELVVTGRFAKPTDLAPAGTVLAPDGMVEVSVSLDAQRAVGGVLKAGDKVGVQLTNEASAEGGVSAFTVYEVFNGVLVTRVVEPVEGDPSALYTVTLAVSPEQAKVVVLGTTSQAVWLSLEEAAPVDAGTSTVSSTTTTATLGDDK